MGGHTHPALTGPPEAGGRLIGGAGAVAPAGRPEADFPAAYLPARGYRVRQENRFEPNIF